MRLDDADLPFFGYVQEGDVRKIARVVVAAGDQRAHRRAAARHQDIAAVQAQAAKDDRGRFRGRVWTGDEVGKVASIMLQQDLLNGHAGAVQDTINAVPRSSVADIPVAAGAFQRGPQAIDNIERRGHVPRAGGDEWRRGKQLVFERVKSSVGRRGTLRLQPFDIVGKRVQPDVDALARNVTAGFARSQKRGFQRTPDFILVPEKRPRVGRRRDVGRCGRDEKPRGKHENEEPDQRPFHWAVL